MGVRQLEVERTWLEMREPPPAPPVAAPPGMRLAEAAPCPPDFYRFLYGQVGHAFKWVDRLRWSAAQLEAYLAEVGPAREVRRIELAPADVPEPLRARWYYGEEPLSLVACFRKDGRVGELFRRVGAAVFKGLGEVVVWELCADGGGPGALAQALGPAWVRSPG